MREIKIKLSFLSSIYYRMFSILRWCLLSFFYILMYLYIDIFYLISWCSEIVYLCWILVTLLSFNLLNNEAHLPLHLKGRSGWILPNDSLKKVTKSYNLGLLSSHELMHDVFVAIASVMLLRLCCMCIKEKWNKT